VPIAELVIGPTSACASSLAPEGTLETSLGATADHSIPLFAAGTGVRGFSLPPVGAMDGGSGGRDEGRIARISSVKSSEESSWGAAWLGVDVTLTTASSASSNDDEDATAHETREIWEKRSWT